MMNIEHESKLIRLMEKIPSEYHTALKDIIKIQYNLSSGLMIRSDFSKLINDLGKVRSILLSCPGSNKDFLIEVERTIEMLSRISTKVVKTVEF